MVRRTAFTMIELIFAIVIMGIAVVSLPVMTQTTDKNVEASIVQEAIFASETILNEAMAYYWDENSQYDESTSGDLSRVINTAGCIAGTPNKRIGHVNRRCLSDITAIGVANNNAVDNTLDYLENYWNNRDVITGIASAGTYKDDNPYKATVTVTQCDGGGCVDFGTLNNADIKEIEVVIQQDGAIITLLRGYSANIGDVEIAKRILP
ncbi:MAG: type II secretion system protein [Sulfurimonas sp.]